MKKVKLTSLFIVQLVLLLPIALSLQVNESGGLFLNVDVPDYANRGSIDISGTTGPAAAVALYVNNELVRSTTAEAEGVFNFPQVVLNVFILNSIRIEASDSQGNFATKSFSTAVDLIAPKVTLNPLPAKTTDHLILIEGSISEEAFLEITVNEELVFAQNLTVFSESISLEEGKNSVKIRAIDLAGNADTISESIILDTEEPIIENIKPAPGSFFYEGNAETDIEGDTEPFAKVALYIDKDPDGEPHFTTAADASGHFEFEDVDIERFFFGFVGARGKVEEKGYIPVPSDEVPEEAESIFEKDKEAELKQEERSVRLAFVARDVVGNKADRDVSYTIGTCFSGGLNWRLTNLVEYQAPNTLNPERLAEGTELISNIFNLTYHGVGSNEKIKSVRFQRACRATSLLDDARYNYSCRVLPSSPSILKPNNQKTMWYLRYNLKKLEGLDTFSDDLWADLTREFIFPLKVRIEYTHEINGKEVRDFQTSCVNLAYNIDTSRVDPRDVLPDWLLGDGLDRINESITELNDLVQKVNTVMKFSAVSCLVGFGLKTITVIWRRWQSWMDFIQDKVLDEDDALKCPTPGGKVEKRFTGGSVKDITQADLTNSELQERCPLAFEAWNTEAQAQNAYRWACDRFLCRSTPARWTETSDIEEVRTRIEQNWLCSETEGTKGIILRKPNPDECKENTGKPECWTYKGSYYIFDRREGKDVILKREDVKGIIPTLGVKDELKVTMESGNVLLPEGEKTCNEICTKDLRADKGECMNAKLGERLIEKKVAHWRGSDVAKDCKDPKPLCVCTGKEKPEVTEKTPPPDTLQSIGAEEEITDKWDYRYDKVGYAYDKYRYYQGRDQSACFGQNNLVMPSDPYLNPQNTIPAFQCACVSQIRNRLVLLRNILQGLDSCLNQIRVTGKADAGVCKEIFTQYVCKWSYRLVSYFRKECVPWTGTGTETDIGDFIKAGSDSIYGGVEESASDLLTDYDNAALRDFIGVGEGAIAEKVCLGAITGDWQWDLEGFMDTAYSAPYHTSASAFPAEREYLTWNPDNDLATYEYRIGWMIAPGCDLSSYSVSLACVTDHELNSFDGARCEQLSDNPNAPPLGCDCRGNNRYPQDKAGPSKTIFTFRRVPQGIFQDASRRDVDEQPYRYDNVKITVYTKNEADTKRCIPEKNRIGSRTGVFYSPIRDMTTEDIAACRWDLVNGQYKCTESGLLWEQRGRAFFGDIRCGPQDSRIRCEDKIFYKGDMLVLDEVPVSVQGRKQCLYVELKNGHGQTLGEPRYFEYLPDPSDPGKWQSYDNALQLWKKKKIKESDFTSAQPVFNAIPSGSGIKRVRTERDVQFGTYEIYFRKVDNVMDYSLDGASWDAFDKDSPVQPIGGMIFTFNPLITQSSRCEASTEPCRKFTIRIVKPTLAITNQPWTVRLELRNFPEGKASCEESVKEDLISYQGIDQRKDIKLRVLPKTEQESKLCKFGGQDLVDHKNTQPCDCNADGVFDDPDKDCDGELNSYCYGETREGAVCREQPRCFTGDRENTRTCDCDWDGDTKDDTPCYEVIDNKGGYCTKILGRLTCTRDKPKADKEPPQFDEDNIQIADQFYKDFKTKEMQVSPQIKLHILVSDNIQLEEVSVDVGVKGNQITKLFPVTGKSATVSGTIDASSLSGSKILTITAKDTSGRVKSIQQKINIVP